MKSKIFYIHLLQIFVLVCLCAGERDLPQEIVDDVRSNKEAVDNIIRYMLEGEGKYVAYKKLKTLTDMFGHRLSGSQSLEDSIDYILEELRQEFGSENVEGENAPVMNWKRGEETLEMVAPRQVSMDILGIGSSVNTTEGGLTAEAVVVRSFDELAALTDDQVKDKIVVYNQPWQGYGPSVAYRTQGMNVAAVRGAKAALVRSVTGYSLYTPHTGIGMRDDTIEPIPTACITVEDAEFMQGLYDEGENITLHLVMKDELLPDAVSRNVIAEIEGSDYPDEVVMFGGHIDSWDVGTGAMDDAGGCIISWQALSVIKALNLRPKRTMRMLMWTGEETGISGANEYYKNHKNESEKMALAMEADSGIFKPYGIGITGSGLARAIMEEIMEMLEPINATDVLPFGGGADIGMWEGVPQGDIKINNEDYFHYHHTKADTMNIMDPDDLDLCTIVWTVANYVVANLEDQLPREGAYPSKPGSAISLGPSILTLVLTILTNLTIFKFY